MDPIVSSSLISGGLGFAGNLVSNVGSARAQKLANKAAIRLSRENNAFNAEQAQISRDWQEKMWNEQNAYNDPSAVRSRMESAGFNPYMTLGSGSFASAGSVGSGSTASSAGNPQLKAPVYNFDMSAVSGAVSQYFANRKMSEETRGLSLQNELTKSFGSTEAKARIAGLIGGNYSLLSPDYQAILMEASPQMAKNYVSMSDLATQEKLIQNSLLNLQSNAQYLQNKYFDTSAITDIFLKVQNLVNLQKQGELTDKQIAHEVEKIVETKARASGLEINNLQAEALSRSYIKAMEESYEQLRQESKNASYIARNLRKSGDLKTIERFDRYSKKNSAIQQGIESYLNYFPQYRLLKTLINSVHIGLGFK